MSRSSKSQSRTRVLPRRRFRPRLELLESRLTPAPMRTIGTEQITDIQANPQRTWESPSDITANQAPEDDALVATQNVTFGWTGPELAAIRARKPDGSPVGFTGDQILAWRQNEGGSLRTVGKTTASYLFTQETTTLTYRPPTFQTSLTAAMPADQSFGRFYIDVAVGDKFTDASGSKTIRITKGAAAGGVLRGPRDGTTGIGYASEVFHTAHAPSPLIPFGSSYMVYTFDSTDGVNFQVSGFNNTGYTLLSASSDLLNDTSTITDPHGTLVFDPSVSFQTVYSAGASTVGNWGPNASGDVWAIRDTLGNPSLFFTGTMYSGVPSQLPGDGQTITVPGSPLAGGNSALWIFFEIPGGSTVGFIIVSPAGSVSPGSKPKRVAMPSNTELASLASILIGGQAATQDGFLQVPSFREALSLDAPLTSLPLLPTDLQVGHRLLEKPAGSVGHSHARIHAVDTHFADPLFVTDLQANGPFFDW